MLMRKNINKILFVFFIMTAFAMSAAAQQVVTGKVTDKDGKVIQGASVSELDVDDRIVNGTSTDIEGNFVLKNVNAKNKISISVIGYKTVTQPVPKTGTTAGGKIDFRLESNQKDIEGVVVVSRPSSSNGLVNIPERNLTVAVARINAKELEEMPSASIDQALQGRLSGVDITANSGDPGAAMNIRI